MSPERLTFGVAHRTSVAVLAALSLVIVGLRSEYVLSNAARRVLPTHEPEGLPLEYIPGVRDPMISAATPIASPPPPFR